MRYAQEAPLNTITSAYRENVSAKAKSNACDPHSVSKQLRELQRSVEEVRAELKKVAHPPSIV
eukprot:267927-Amphidinium_carterae.1